MKYEITDEQIRRFAEALAADIPAIGGADAWEGVIRWQLLGQHWASVTEEESLPNNPLLVSD
jgi:hypothetical protein